MADPAVICLTNGAFAENCYIVADVEQKKAVLVDPGQEGDLFLSRLAVEGLDLESVWLTHAHIDHIMGVGRVVERTGVPVYLHPADRGLYGSIDQQGAWLGIRAETQPEPSFDLAAGDRLTVGTHKFEVREVPGHSPGGVAFVGDGIVFSGDALFAGSIGRTDLPGGDFETLISRIGSELLSLPDETVVYSGHGPATTIGRERSSNPFLVGI